MRFLIQSEFLPPDIDVDFAKLVAAKSPNTSGKKYGERRVAQIITFGRLKARSVVRDVARVMGTERAGRLTGSRK